MSFKRRSEGVWELVRYATSSVVRGGFSRLLRAFERAHRPREVVSFADRMISDGGLYESHGFIADGVTKPSYMYVVGHQRVHKFNYRISRFKKDPDLKFKDGLTESELAKLNGIHKVYDAGKVRYVKDYTVGVEYQ